MPPDTGASAKQQAKPAGSSGNSAVHKELLALKKELASLKAAKAPSDTSPTGAQASAEALALSDDDKAAVKTLQKQVQQLKELGPELRASLCDPQGGYETFVASLEDKWQAIFAKHRGTMPLDVQRQKSQQFLKNVQKHRDDAESALTELQRQSNDLEEKVARQRQCFVFST